MNYLLYTSILLLVGCGPGMSDYSDPIGDTGYVFSRTSPIGKEIWPQDDQNCFSACAGINSIVLGYDFNEFVIAAVRQIRNDFHCDEGHASAQITDEIVFEYIDLVDGTSSGPVALEKMKTIMISDKFSNIDYQKLMDSIKHKQRALSLGQCTNPKLM
ncbi:hypothetical protein FT643_22860 [Ketobacter sp. MCCC 1A13808]|uniref:hypothetical protein n=1 Tax=Ketobacter sp. MCCC 1A13808 TaxID=2602738 RepID=UPI0012EBB06C|nr:hypothetical protein [Ketobacter sp. MCCC 1A13808]MVF14970.1 hypothetical protein [Ketobacter sp. MCCC 1A13808]